MMGTVDNAHLATAGAYLVLAYILFDVAFRLWWTHPVNRPFVLDGFLTQKGARLLLRLWPFVFLFGAFILACAVDHALSFFYDAHRHPPRPLQVAAVAEAVISWATAILLVRVWWCWDKWKH